jgi:putative DNA-invertase from lambdoid prophage Rac
VLIIKIAYLLIDRWSGEVSRIAYYRVSTEGQSIEAQRQSLDGTIDKEFMDEGVSGSVLAADRPGFAKLLSYVREGDILCVYALDRLGRDALDVQTIVRRLLNMGVTVEVRGLGVIGRGVGEIIVSVLAQVADMERHRIKERCDAGRVAARASFSATGRTHRGKTSLGRPAAADAQEVAAWRKANNASLQSTMERFGISEATVVRYCRQASTR